MTNQSSSKGKTIGIIVAVAVVVLGVLGVAVTQFMPKTDNSMAAQIDAQIEDAEQAVANAGQNVQEEMDEAGEQIAEAKSSDEDAAPEQAASVKSSEDVVVATVDGEEIKKSDVMRFMEAQNMAGQDLDSIFPLALDQVIRGQVVINEASEANLDNDPEVQEQLEAAKKHIVNTVFLQRTVDSKITEDRIKSAYDAHIKKMPDQEERRARHILVKTEQEAKDLIKELDGGADFEELAKANSTGPTGPRGGDLGYFTKDQMVKPFADQAFAMKAGEYTKEPVKTEFGYHVIKVEDARQKPKPSLDELKEFIVIQLRQEILNEKINDWKKDAEIQKFDMNGEPVANN